MTTWDQMKAARAAALAESWRLREEPRMFPLNAIAPYLPDNRMSCRNLRTATRVGWHTAQAWTKAGEVDEPAADLIATRLGVHPSAIWDNWWETTAA